MSEPLLANQRQSNTPYVIAVVVMCLIAVIAVLGLSLIRPLADNTVLITMILGFLAPTTMALLAFIKAQETHLSVNSRMEQMMTIMKHASFAEGVKSAEALILNPVPLPPVPVTGDAVLRDGDTIMMKKE